MIALPIISIVCCIAYIVYVLFKYGVPVSISETYYLLPNKWDWLFAAWSILTAVPFGIYWWQVSPDNLKWIPITVMIALLLVGAACCYKSGPKAIDGYKPKIHCGENPNWYIRKGDKFKCIKDVYMYPTNEIAYIKGNVYKSERDWCLTDEQDAKDHWWLDTEIDYFNEHFEKTEASNEKWWQKLVEYLKSKFNPKVFFKYPARCIHYVNSLVAIILSTIYICKTCGSQAVAATIISYAVWILIGMKVDGVYNPDYSLDVNNKAWIFFMEIICLTNLFIFIW